MALHGAGCGLRTAKASNCMTPSRHRLEMRRTPDCQPAVGQAKKRTEDLEAVSDERKPHLIDGTSHAQRRELGAQGVNVLFAAVALDVDVLVGADIRATAHVHACRMMRSTRFAWVLTASTGKQS